MSIAQATSNPLVFLKGVVGKLVDKIIAPPESDQALEEKIVRLCNQANDGNKSIALYLDVQIKDRKADYHHLVTKENGRYVPTDEALISQRMDLPEVMVSLKKNPRTYAKRSPSMG